MDGCKCTLYGKEKDFDSDHANNSYSHSLICSYILCTYVVNCELYYIILHCSWILYSKTQTE